MKIFELDLTEDEEQLAIHLGLEEYLYEDEDKKITLNNMNRAKELLEMLPDNLDNMIIECGCGKKLMRKQATRKNKTYYCGKCFLRNSLDFFNDRAEQAGIITKEQRI